jgi:hypothetical protein
VLWVSRLPACDGGSITAGRTASALLPTAWCWWILSLTYLAGQGWTGRQTEYPPSWPFNAPWLSFPGYTRIAVPFWPFIFAAGGAALWTYRRSLRLHGHCPHCAYSSLISHPTPPAPSAANPFPPWPDRPADCVIGWWATTHDPPSESAMPHARIGITLAAKSSHYREQWVRHRPDRKVECVDAQVRQMVVAINNTDNPATAWISFSGASQARSSVDVVDGRGSFRPTCPLFVAQRVSGAWGGIRRHGHADWRTNGEPPRSAGTTCPTEPHSPFTTPSRAGTVRCFRLRPTSRPFQQPCHDAAKSVDDAEGEFRRCRRWDLCW